MAEFNNCIFMIKVDGDDNDDFDENGDVDNDGDDVGDDDGDDDCDAQVDGTLSPVSMHAGHGMDTLDNDTTGRRKVTIMLLMIMMRILKKNWKKVISTITFDHLHFATITLVLLTVKRGYRTGEY